MRVCKRKNCDGCPIRFCAYCKHWHVGRVHVSRRDADTTETHATGVCRAPIRHHLPDFGTCADEAGCAAFAFSPDRVQTKMGCRHV